MLIVPASFMLGEQETAHPLATEFKRSAYANEQADYGQYVGHTLAVSKIVTATRISIHFSQAIW